ncbi:hypothetical protein H2200_005280 [Cladophialophora chaetospira]|uniref:Nucleoside phosphorylase domain-containing protein n=1 Tax=Cladophialophora chaetospira TaxID=386627 RepID=A0AA38XBP0_9EURO|nr:hypothetical protein H2200_005280 [Cladophialophora chaetospira]
MPSPPTCVDEYALGWISAIQTEYVIACELLEEEYDPLSLDLPNDNNAYTLGRIASHNVVLACLPKGRYGLTSATSVAKDMLRTFPCLRFGLMVGIGGGAPTKTNDIRLGDIVVSTPSGGSAGVIHYEYGKAIQDKAFLRTGSLSAPPPPPLLLAAIQQLSSLHLRRGHQIAKTIRGAVDANSRLQKYLRPSLATDVLFKASFVHADQSRRCTEICDVPDKMVDRSPREADQDDPGIHYGLIASADRLMKDAHARDALADTENILCFEMEAAGLMDNFPCIVIRGICDYSDTHKNDDWQGYAAATAAAYARELLMTIPSIRLKNSPTYVLSEQITELPTRVHIDARLPKGSVGTLRIPFARAYRSADTKSPAAIFTVPFERDPLFVPRDEISAAIDLRLEETHRAILYGLGGTGKSQIAIEFAYQYRHTHTSSSVFWLHAATPTRIIDGCQEIARRLRLPGSNDPSKDMYRSLARWLEDEVNGPWLLIIDGADDDMVLGQDLLQGSKPDRLLAKKTLIDFIPRRLDSLHLLLFTTRSRDIADSVVSTGSPIHIGPFTTEEGRLLLLRRLETGLQSPSVEVVDQTLETLGNIPLAITQAAAFVNRNGGSLQQHLFAFRHSEGDRRLQLSIELQDPRRERGVPNSIFRTWKLSFDQIREHDAEAADLLSLMSVLDGQSIPETLIKNDQIADTAWRHSLGTILGYSLASQGPERTMTMHPLVQMCVRYWLEHENRIAKYVEKVIHALASKFPTGTFENQAVCQTLWPQAETALRYQSTCDESGAALLHKIAWFEWTYGYFEQAENHIRKSYDVRRQLLGENSTESLSTLSLTAIILQARGKYAAAEEMQQKVLEG